MGLLIAANGARIGLCIRVSTTWLLTAHHVIDIPELAHRFRAERFGFLSSNDSWVSAELDPEAGFFSSQDGIYGRSGSAFDLDYLFVKMREPTPHWANEPELSVSIDAPKIATRCWIPQFPCKSPASHPSPPRCFSQYQPDSKHEQVFCNEPLKVETPDPKVPGAGTFSVCEDLSFPYVYHMSSTYPGRSGGAIFNEDWQLVGIHTHSYSNNHILPEQKVNNWGTRITTIVEDAASRGFDVDQIPCLRHLTRK